MILGGFQYVNLGNLTLIKDGFGWYSTIIPRDIALKFSSDKPVILQSLILQLPELSVEMSIRNFSVNIMLHTDQFTSNTDTYYFTALVPTIIGGRLITTSIIAVTIPKTDMPCTIGMYIL